MTSSFAYPDVSQEATVEDYHGTKITDPYKWMEDPDSEMTKKFVTSQNELSLPYLKSTPIQKKFEDRMSVVFNYPKYSCTFKKGKKYFYYYNTGLQNQNVLYMQDSLTSEGKVFIDPNKFSEDGTVSMSGTSFTQDGNLCAYSVNKSGSDWATIKFKNVETGEDLPDVLERVKFSCKTWSSDNKGLFYNAYIDQEGKTDGTETTTNINQKLLYHRLGTPQSEDVIFAEFPDNPKWMSGVEVTEDGEYLLLSISEGCEHVNRLWFARLQPLLQQGMNKMPEWTKLIDNFDASFDMVANDGSVFTFETNLKAPRKKLIRIDLNNPEQENWKTIVEEHSRDVLEDVLCVNNDVLVMCYLRDVKNVIELHRMSDGSLIKTLETDIGSTQGMSGRRNMDEFFMKFTSFLSPGVIYHYDFKTDSLKVLRQIEVKGVDSSKFVTSQIFYPSKDGTKVPMFIVHKKDIVLDGSHPLLLYGYGGFNITIGPAFSVSRLIFLENLGGILAVANIRGGGEYGEDWHKAGTKLNKQNVFDDFQAAAEYLINNKYTQAKKLAINGGSNGGLLVAACTNQRPELFGCSVAQVGVMDMLNFHKYTIGHAWTTDYGCSDDAKYFNYLYRYSPLHNVPDDVQFPSMLLMTGDHDDRVVPHHSLKYIATVQRKLGKTNNNPLMIRVDTKSGHGAGKPTSKVIEEVSDMYGFISMSVGAEWRD